MSLQFFCLALPHPIWNLLKQSPLRRRQIQSILKLWPPSETAVQKCSACSAVHPSNWPFAKQALNASLAMSQQAFFAPLSHKNSEQTFFSIFTTFHIWRGSPPGVRCILGMSGEFLPPTSPFGPSLPPLPAGQDSSPHAPAATANPPSCSNVSLICTLIWWDPCSTVAVAISFLLSLTAYPNGWKQFLCLTWHGGMR